MVALFYQVPPHKPAADTSSALTPWKDNAVAPPAPLAVPPPYPVPANTPAPLAAPPAPPAQAYVWRDLPTVPAHPATPPPFPVEMKERANVLYGRLGNDLREAAGADNVVKSDGRGRPRKFTGPGWDELSRDDYMKKARIRQNRERAELKDNPEAGYRYIEMLPDKIGVTPRPASHWSPECHAAYEQYTAAQNEINDAIERFRSYQQIKGTEVEALRAAYITLAEWQK